MANPKYTRRASDTIVLMQIGSGGWAADDAHLTIGKGSGDHASYTGRAEFKVPEADWPSAGRLVKATMTFEPSRTTSHSDFDGGSPRIELRRMGAKAKFNLPSSADGHGSSGYTQSGTGDKYPGASVAGSPVTFNISGKTTRDVTSMIRRMLPTRLGGDNELYGHFQIRSADEDSANRSVVLSTRITLTVEVDIRVTPAEATILEVIGAQPGEDDPTIVASDDGRTLEVRFGFAAGAGETAAKAELEMRVVGATDEVPGTLIKSSGNVAPLPGGGQNIYVARLTGLPAATEGKWRLRATSSSGKQGPWTSLEDSTAHVLLARIPPAPVDIVVQPYTDDPHVLFSLDSPVPTDTITGAQAVVTLLPQGTLLMDSGMEDVGGSVRRADLTISSAIADGQETSTVVRLRNQDQVVGRYSAPVRQTHRVRQGPVVTPEPGRLLTLRPTFTITDALFDGYQLRLLHETDDDIELYDTGPITVVNQTSVAVQVPVDTLAYGQRFRVVASTKPDGGSVFGPESIAQAYSIAALPTTALSVPDAIAGKVGVESVEWLIVGSDPDGAAPVAHDLELRTAATPQGGGALQRRYTILDTVIASDGPLYQIPTADGEVSFESSVDARARTRNDVTALASTTLNGALSAGATSLVLTSATGFAIGQDIRIASSTATQYEIRRIANLVTTTVTLDEALDYAHASGQGVVAYQYGPWSAWRTITALEPPDVDLLTPADLATVTRPWQTLDWSTTGHAGRTQASAVVGIYDADGTLVASVDVTTDSEADVPAFVLEDATDYAWDVTATDTEGMATRSLQRTFGTTFTDPAALTAVTASEDEEGIVLSWDEILDSDLHHVEVSWQADDGAWVRIDGGPEGAGDTDEPFTGTTLTHIGARLGSNTYTVAPHNGWHAAEPVSATAVLGWHHLARGSWELVRSDGTTLAVSVSDAPFITDGVVDLWQPPGGVSQAHYHGIAARRVSLRASVLPAEDGSLVTVLRQLLADPGRGRAASPCWVRSPSGYVLDPVWAALTTFTSSPESSGLMDVSMDWVEVGGAVHAILPPAPEEPPDGVAQIFTDLDELDFGTIEFIEP